VVAGIVAAALLAGAVAVVLTVLRDHQELRAVGHPESPVFVLLIGWSFIGSGVVAWRQRPHNRFGALLMVVGFAWFAATLEASNDAVPFSIGRAIAPLWIGVFVHALLAFPTGRLETRPARLLVAVYYVDVIVVQLAWLMFADLEGTPGCARCPENLLLIADLPALANALFIVEQPVVGVLTLAGVLVVLGQRWSTATAPRRRVLAPVLVSGGICVLVLLVTILVEPFSYTAGQVVGWVGGVAFAAVPLAFLYGLLRQTIARSAIGHLVVELGQPLSRPDLRAALRRALGDASLEVAYWLPDSDTWVDTDGRVIRVPPPDAGVASTVVDHGGQRVAALLHDDSLRDQPDLVDGVSAAAGLALANARLLAELAVHLDELRESRSRIVEVGDAERRRLERNLHDGAQQRLLSVAVELRLLESRLSSRPADATLAGRAREELERSLDELREVARGIHPAVLSDHGLGVALEAVAARCAVPVRLHVALDGRLPAPVEAAAYYVVCEGLANAVRHARASRSTVRIDLGDHRLLVEVRDDGVGGADVARGSGLRGLADRIAALDGRFTVTSAPGLGTTIAAEIPCAS
jgi:signal transduction histidine kinase